MDVSGRSVKSQFKLASAERATHCVVVGETELANQTVVLKDLKTTEQTTVARADLVGRLKSA
jgi:histidyl-tRNA synthetase